MEIPGITAKHAIITDQCRSGRGDEGALKEAFDRIRKEYRAILAARAGEEGNDYHVVLSIHPAVMKERDAAQSGAG